MPLRVAQLAAPGARIADDALGRQGVDDPAEVLVLRQLVRVELAEVLPAPWTLVRLDVGDAIEAEDVTVR